MISLKYSKMVGFLLFLPMIPVLIHTYIGAKQVDSYRTENISHNLRGIEFQKSDRDESWGQEILDSIDWIERKSVSTQGRNILLFVARSYNYKRLYHHPELAILYGKSFRKAGVQSLKTDTGRAVNAHILVNQNGNGIAGYCLLHNSEFIENPIWFQLSTSLKLLISETKPMTLFFVYDNSLSSHENFDSSQASAVLKDAIENFFAQET